MLGVGIGIVKKSPLGFGIPLTSVDVSVDVAALVITTYGATVDATTIPIAPVLSIHSSSDRGSSSTDNVSNDPTPRVILDVDPIVEAGDTLNFYEDSVEQPGDALTITADHISGATPINWADLGADATTSLQVSHTNGAGESPLSNAISYTLDTSLGTMTTTITGGGDTTGDSNPSWDYDISSTSLALTDYVETRRASDGFPLVTHYLIGDPPAVDFDGDARMTNQSLSGLSDTKVGTVSFWVNMQNASPTGQELVIAANPFIFTVGFVNNSTNYRFSVLAKNSGGTTILSATSTTDINSASGGVHFLCSWNLATSAFDLYIDDTDDSLTPSTITDDSIDYTTSIYYYGSGGGIRFIEAYLAEVYINTDEYVDISNVSNRRKFIDASGLPVDLGSDGSTPTTNQPAFYFAGVADGYDNLGYAGSFTSTGGSDIVDAAYTPGTSEVATGTATAVSVLALDPGDHDVIHSGYDTDGHLTPADPQTVTISSLPALVIHDDFADMSASQTLHGHTPDTVDNGNTWVLEDSDFLEADGSTDVVMGTSAETISSAAIDSEITSDAMRIEFEITLDDDANDICCFILGDGTTSGNGRPNDAIICRFQTNSNIGTIYEVVGGSLTVLDGGGGINIPTSTPTVIAFEINGDGDMRLEVGGVESGTLQVDAYSVDAGLTGQGYCGICTFQNAASNAGVSLGYVKISEIA